MSWDATLMMFEMMKESTNELELLNSKSFMMFSDILADIITEAFSEYEKHFPDDFQVMEINFNDNYIKFRLNDNTPIFNHLNLVVKSGVICSMSFVYNTQTSFINYFVLDGDVQSSQLINWIDVLLANLRYMLNDAN